MATESSHVNSYCLAFYFPQLELLSLWLKRYLKALDYRDPITSLSDIIECIEYEVSNIPQFTLFSTIEHAFSRFQIIADIGGPHIEHVLQTFANYLYFLNKAT